MDGPDHDRRGLQMISIGRLLLVLVLLIPGLLVSAWQWWAVIGLAVGALVLWEVQHHRRIRARRTGGGSRRARR